jgi:hypothetical protein
VISGASTFVTGALINSSANATKALLNGPRQGAVTDRAIVVSYRRAPPAMVFQIKRPIDVRSYMI